MHITVKSLTGRVYPIELADGATLDDLREAVQDSQGIPTQQQRFIVLDEAEINSLPYGEQKINEFCAKRHRDLKGDTSPLTENGVKEGDTLLLVLSLRAATEETEEAVDDVASLLRDMTWSSRGKTNTPKDIDFITKSYRDNRQNNEIVENACRAMFVIYLEQPELLRQNDIVKDVYEDFKTQTNPDVVRSMCSFFEGACRANIDGMILKLVDMGVIQTAIEKLRIFPNESKYTLSHTQSGLRDLLKEAAKNHDPLKSEVAFAFNKDTLASDEHYVLGVHFTSYNAAFHLWDKPLKFYENNRYDTELELTILGVKGISLAAKDSNGLSDPYFEVGVEPEYGKAFKPQIKSSIIKKTLNPVWDMSKEKKATVKFTGEQDIRVMVYDDDLIGSDFMGQVEFNPACLYALQEAAFDAPLPFITIGLELESFERTTKNIKHHRVSGEIEIKVHITKVKL